MHVRNASLVDSLPYRRERVLATSPLHGRRRSAGIAHDQRVTCDPQHGLHLGPAHWLAR